MPYFVYVLRGSKGLYIGKTNNLRRRFNEHIFDRRGHFWRGWRLHGERPSMEILSQVNTPSECDLLERWWISAYGWCGVLLDNRAPGGAGGHLKGHSEFTRRRISETKRGVPVPSERQERIAATLRGRKMPEEQRQRMIGRKQSTETIAKRVAHYKERGSLYKSSEARQRVVNGIKRRHKGVPKSLEHRAKVAEGMRRYWASLTPERKAEIESQTLRRRWA